MSSNEQCLPVAITDPANTAIFAAGCFWGVEKFFVKKFGDAILDRAVGYTDGHTTDVTYKKCCTGQTGHCEALYIKFDPAKVKYEELLNYFYSSHDPTTMNRQQGDVGPQYRSGIFYFNEEQKSIAEKITGEMQHKWKEPIVTTIKPASTFYRAEEYHQRYLEKNPDGYCSHRDDWLSK